MSDRSRFAICCLIQDKIFDLCLLKKNWSHTVKQQTAVIPEAFVNHISVRVVTADERPAQPLRGTGKTAQKKSTWHPWVWGGGLGGRFTTHDFNEEIRSWHLSSLVICVMNLQLTTIFRPDGHPLIVKLLVHPSILMRWNHEFSPIKRIKEWFNKRKWVENINCASFSQQKL